MQLLAMKEEGVLLSEGTVEAKHVRKVGLQLASKAVEARGGGYTSHMKACPGS